jgi:hypothetical protein
VNTTTTRSPTNSSAEANDDIDVSARQFYLTKIMARRRGSEKRALRSQAWEIDGEQDADQAFGLGVEQGRTGFDDSTANASTSKPDGRGASAPQ